MTGQETMEHPPYRFAIYSIIASIITIILKFGAYFITDSMGLFADATESFINLAAGIMALAALVVARRPADENHAYGHGKVEYFSSGMEGIFIIAAAVGIVTAAVGRFSNPVELNRLGLGIVLSFAASGINYFTARVMLGGAREYDSIVLEADAKHLMTDVWTSAGMVLGLSVILIAPPSWRIVDPIVAIVMALNIVYSGISLISRSASGLMDKSLPKEEIDAITRVIADCAGEEATFHGFRSRKSGSLKFVDFHLLVKGETTVKQAHDLCLAIENKVYEQWPRTELTIHVEPIEDCASYDGKMVGGYCGGSGTGPYSDNNE